MKQFVLLFIHLYRLTISPLLHAATGGQACRFLPSCSAYALEAVQKHGALRGGVLTIKRLCKCHPWGEAGVDPVPACLSVKSEE